MNLTDWLFLIITASNCIFLVVIIYNYYSAPQIINKAFPQVVNEYLSILIPARNEENNIGKCLESILSQSYNNFEIIVLDDESTDSTSAIVEQYALKDERIKLVKGNPLPKDWLGKNWACYQLAGRANGNMLLFVDADIRLAENAVASALGIFKKNNVKMLSVFPTQKIKSFGSHLITPLMNWLLLTFLPLKKVYDSKNKSFVAANGQFILFDKNVYSEIGGHKIVKAEVVEDMELARIVKSKDYRIITALGGNSIFCEMYSSLKDSFIGFSKNFFPGFKINPFVFLVMISFFLIIFLLPVALVFFDIRFVIVIVVLILQRAVLSKMSSQNILINIILHPLQMIFMFLIGINSVTGTLTKSLKWKDRKI